MKDAITCHPEWQSLHDSYFATQSWCIAVNAHQSIIAQSGKNMKIQEAKRRLHAKIWGELSNGAIKSRLEEHGPGSDPSSNSK
jgi:hypothetical protein